MTVVSSRQAALSGSRDQDTSPWWGGSRIVRPGDVKCTSGFPVSIGSAYYLVTAAHCGGINTSWDVGPLYVGDSGSPAFLGTEVNRIAADDTAIIRVGMVQSYVYDKGWNSTVGEHVIGKHDSVVNGYICTEGATAGVRCNGKIIVTNDLEWFNNIGWIGHLDEAESPSLINASGDSGGPVIMNSSTAGQVWVAGTITGYDTNYTIACPSGLDPNVYAPNCSNTVFYEDVNTILSDWGAQVITWL